MSYKTRWYDRNELAQVAAEVWSDEVKLFGIELEDLGGNDIHMNGGWGANVEEKLVGAGVERIRARHALGADDEELGADDEE